MKPDLSLADIDAIAAAVVSKLADSAPKLALKPREAAAALGISERSLWDKKQAGEIAYLSIASGGKRESIVYPVEALHDYVRSHTKRKAD